MTNQSGRPADDTQEPIESRRAAASQPDPSAPLQPGGAEEEPSPQLPNFGELAPEAARPTPLDEIAEAEREQAPRD